MCSNSYWNIYQKNKPFSLLLKHKNFHRYSNIEVGYFFIRMMQFKVELHLIPSNFSSHIWKTVATILKCESCLVSKNTNWYSYFISKMASYKQSARCMPFHQQIPTFKLQKLSANGTQQIFVISRLILYFKESTKEI